MDTAVPTNVVDDVGDALVTALAQILLDGDHVNITLWQVARVVRNALTDIDEVSVTLLDGEKAQTLVFTGRLAVELDERQYQSGQGPCLDASKTGNTVVVDTNDPANPYPEFSRAAQRAGIHHSVSVGLPIPDRIVGALNMYASTRHPIQAHTIKLAEAFAQYASVTVANASTYHKPTAQAEQMREALTSRAVIDQAKGVLMERHGYTADEAFTLLANTSQRTNRKLSDIAAAIVKQAPRPI
jgi:transcriptional regulator with GAF, ATPase, and Fis domain